MEKNKRNVMWRACLDLQENLEEVTLKRAEIANRKKLLNGEKKIKGRKKSKETKKSSKQPDSSPS
jgi:hypothetical protein